MGQMTWIDSDELEALRTLARSHLERSEMDGSQHLDASDGEGPQPPSDGLGTLSRGVDVQSPIVHADWYVLTLNQRSVISRLAAAYPDYIPHSQLASRFRRTDVSPELEKPIADAATIVCHIRADLGDDAIETVYEYRTNRKGQLVRVGKSLGYRLGARYAAWLNGDA